MSLTFRVLVSILAAAILGCGSAAEDAIQEVLVVFLHFDGERVVFELDSEVVFDRVLTTEDHTMGHSHSEPLDLSRNSTIRWTVDGREYEQQLEIDPEIGLIFITLGQPRAELFEGNELLLD